jgi:hypothetical protein
VSCCLDELYDSVVSGGYVIFDDYLQWDGCARAVHEFLAKRGLPYKLRELGSIMYFRKIEGAAGGLISL